MDKSTSQFIENKTLFDPFAGPEIRKVVHITQAQSEIWTACNLGSENANKAFNLSLSIVFKGELNRIAMVQALQTMVQRHEALRAVFSTDGRYMSIFTDLPIKLYYKDISEYSKTEKEITIAKYVQREVNYLFDLVNGPLLKTGLIKIGEHEYQLILMAHHIICDGWSLGVMMQELGILYSAYVQNKTPDLPEPVSFSAYSESNQALIESKEYLKVEQFWLDQYKQSIPRLDLTTDYPRPSLRTYESQQLDFTIPEELVEALKKTGVQLGCSFVTTLLGAFEILLYQLTGQDNLIIGLPAAGQAAGENKHLIGHCANLLPLKSAINANTTFNEYLKQRKSYLLDAYDHQQLSFGHLLQKLNISRDPSRVPLVPVIFNMDIGLANGVSFEGLSYSLKSNPRNYEIFELFVNASGSENKLVLEWSYNTSLFKAATIKQMMATFEKILHRIVAEPEKTISYLTKTMHTAYLKLNKTHVNYTKLPLHELLAEQALAKPQRLALKFNDNQICYKDLQKKANQLSHYFYEKGLRPYDLIGVCLPRSSEMLISLLAIMKCGAAYLPMDPEYPKERLQFMLEDSQAKFLMATHKFSKSLTVTSSLLFMEDAFSEIDQFLDTPLELKVSQDAVVYLLYTSGSTGKPKGVEITHGNLVNFLVGMAKEPGIDEDDKLLAITTISFDIAGLELYLPLLKGACVVMTDTETARDPFLLLELLEKEKITVLQGTPTTWRLLLDANWEHPLKLKAFCGGEALPLNLAKRILSRCDSLWNLYGPTEVTIWATVKKVLESDELISIGKPIANTQIYILNEQDQLMPPGTIGEIVIGGDGVGKGYWKRPDLTANKFLKNLFEKNDTARIYRSGDLGKLLPTGEVQCFGRLDEQIKIRGHRVEPGEIEHILLKQENVHAAAVIARENRLIAYIVPVKILDKTSEQISQWRNCLDSSLPSYLVPNEYRILEALPTTPAGKLDRKALVELQDTKNISSTTHFAPKTEMERIIATIWEECLGIDEVSIDSDFFELGGHSLLAVKVMSRLEQKTGCRYPVVTLLEYSTIKKMAILLDKENTSVVGNSLVPLKPEGNKIPLYLIHGVGYSVVKFNDMIKHLHEDQPVYGLQGKGNSGQNENLESVKEIAAHYIAAMIKSNPKGPYALAGYSYGGIIAYEMASQLTSQGRKVSMLAILDTILDPEFYYSSYFRKTLARMDYQIKQKLVVLNDMRKSWENVKFHLNRTRRNRINRKLEKRSPENDYLMKVVNANEKIVKRYQIIPEDFEIDLFRAQNFEFFMYDPIYLGWKDIALKGLHIHEVLGDHRDMFSPPNDKITANVLQSILDQRNT
jgi:amino acid adenylation domain-containing protein